VLHHVDMDGLGPYRKLALYTCPEAVSWCAPPMVQRNGDGHVRH